MPVMAGTCARPTCALLGTHAHPPRGKAGLARPAASRRTPAPPSPPLAAHLPTRASVQERSAPQGKGPGAPKTTASDGQWMDRSVVFLPGQDLLGFESIFNIKYLLLVSTRVKWKIKKKPRLNYTEKALRRLLAGLTAQGEC